jgi:hypothetical protein
MSETSGDAFDMLFIVERHARLVLADDFIAFSMTASVSSDMFALGYRVNFRKEISWKQRIDC